MRVAVNTRFLLKDHLEGVGYFIHETFRRIVKSNPEHEFLFIFDRPFDQRFISEKNVTAIVAGPAARHPLLWKYWYDVRIPTILKKWKADVFVSGDGFCSLATKVPQCLVVHDLSFVHFPSFNKRSHLFFYRHYTPRFLLKAKTIVTVSQFSKNDILSKYPVPDDKIYIVPNAVKSLFTALGYSEKETIKSKYTEGREYFLYTGAIHPRKNLTNLLKAFSVFKKRQKSNWKLVLAGRLAWKYNKFVEDLKTYKYREDVVMTGYLPEDELAKLTASAYAAVYPSYWEGFGVPVLEALCCNVPVITSKDSAMQELAGPAAIYADPSQYQDIAEKMMLLYKDEKLRNEMILEGKSVCGEYSWDKSAKLFWDAIVGTVDRQN
jgi:glycosyltransferase involved in cell wall biosynthesis